MSKRILIVEDEDEIARLVSLHLEEAGYEVVVSADGLEALRLAMVPDWDLLILDLGLPGIDGLEICRRLRAVSDMTPILMLTARSAEVDRVVGLEMGADDYLTKPFGIHELVARVKAILRRVEAMAREPSREEDLLEVDDLSIELPKRRVVLDDREIQLTAREFDLLVHFARHPGRVYSRAELLDQVWGYGHEGYEHTVNTHINRLRGKLERDPANPELILTVWGVGYKFRDHPAAAEAKAGDPNHEGARA